MYANVMFAHFVFFGAHNNHVCSTFTTSRQNVPAFDIWGILARSLLIFDDIVTIYGVTFSLTSCSDTAMTQRKALKRA